jgi:hypothetical protein
MHRAAKMVAPFLCAVCLLSFPVVALAEPGSPDLGSAAAGVYGTPGGETLGGVEQGGSSDGRSNSEPATDTGAVSPATTGGSDLPFTGLSAMLVLAAAVTLLCFGGLLRLFVRRADRTT